MQKGESQVFSVIYDLVIQPLVFAYDLLFSLLYRALRDPASTILALSIVINFIVLPLYKKADALQQEEQAKKRAMDPWVKHIRKHFSGSEQFMMLSAYYKVESYSPLSFLKEAVPLLLQIPFFMAAYRFISSLDILEGASFWRIADLSKPDGLLAVGGTAVNVLPILMTVINLISGAVYSKGSTLRLKGQILITALIFLALLYDSPSGLVIYWTMNNLFSLGKNVVFKLPEKAKRYFKLFVAFFLVFMTEQFALYGRIQSVFAETIILLALVYIFYQLLREKKPAFFDKHFPKREHPEAGRMCFFIYFLSVLALAVLLGLYIPSTVVVSSVIEFMNTADGSLNSALLTYPASIYAGLLVIWLTVFYFSSGDAGRRKFAMVLSAVLLFALLNQFVFSKSFGTLYTSLKFDGAVYFPVLTVILNIAVGLLALGGCALLLNRKPLLLRNVAAILAITLLSLSVKNIVTIRSQAENQTDALNNPGIVSYSNLLRLSRTEKNVIVFMLDRAISGYAPFIFEEKPELLESYDGFVYYPDTLSFGTRTNFGAPGLFGGYEYTPAEMNKRSTEPLVEKHDQALLLMPILFSQQGFDVTICDPPYAGYQEPPDLSIFDDYPELKAYRLTGMFSEDYTDIQNSDFEHRQQRNFVMYGLYRTAPLFLRGFVYDNGTYLHNYYKNVFSKELIDSYSVLAELEELTAVDDEERGSFLLLQNATPHNPAALTPPDYSIDPKADFQESSGTEKHEDRELNGRVMQISRSAQWAHYSVNVATYQELAKWLDYLKEQGVYDNTRIILVADHGYWALGQFADLQHPDGLDIQGLNPLLMVKDFDTHGPLTVCEDFMTNADVPTLAMEGVIENPINPFTGKPITNEAKNGVLYVTDSANWNINNNDGTTFDTQDGSWWAVHDSIFDMDNWKRVEEEEVTR